MNLIEQINVLSKFPQNTSLSKMKKEIFIFYKYQSYITQGIKILDALEFTSIDFNICTKTVFNIVKKYKDVNNNHNL